MTIDLQSVKIPKRIGGLNELAYNLWWSWRMEARNLFKMLDRVLWKETNHNPVKLLQRIAPHELIAAAEDAAFLRKYDTVMQDFQSYMNAEQTWFKLNYPHLSQQTIAYFSMEFAIHSSLPIYAGGLGILAGDYCKEASDLGLPLTGIGFMYPQGYFHQRISEDGWQQEVYDQLNFAEAPIERVFDARKQPLKVKVDLDTRSVAVTVWQVKVGRVKLYLLDTNLEENSPPDRQLSARLYGGDGELRLQQEILLGIGGVQVLRALGLEPSIWHANEGHTTFMMLERCRELVQSGIDFTAALDQIRQTTVFTTHTPVPAGNDIFSAGLIEKYFYRFRKDLGLGREAFLKLGEQSPQDASFNMTALGMGMASQRNGVSQLHGKVCRKMWHSLWPDSRENEVPIISITNGIHIPTWVAPQMAQLYIKYLGPDWLGGQDGLDLWDKVMDIPDGEIWAVHRWLKYKLINVIGDRARKRWREDCVAPGQALAMGSLLDPEVLTIGYCRRFTDYKRASLILYDLERLNKLLQDNLRPVQIIFSGKAHPHDEQGKHLIQEIYRIAKDCKFGGRIAFVENYDTHLAHYLIQGVDIWLNTPRILQEASGTSGMKAALNGVPHLSVLDGWWCEGYNGANGWAIGTNNENPDTLSRDREDADDLYRLLDEKIIPLYYNRGLDGLPHDWIRIVKEAIRSNAPAFSMRRMAKEYMEQMYVTAAPEKFGRPAGPG